MSRSCDSRYDAVVIGAGVGGAALALHLARRLDSGRRVLLVDRSAWPRAKVCGCCLNSAALAMLEQLGIAPTMLRAIGQRLTRVEVRRQNRSARWAIPEGLAIPRATLDALLVQEATRAGVEFLSECTAKVLAVRSKDARPDGRLPASDVRVALRTPAGPSECSAPLVIVADGLAGSALDAWPEFRAEIQPSSWIGLGGMVQDDIDIPSGTIALNIGPRGYVGLVRLADKMVCLAAAIDPTSIGLAGGPEAAIRSILRECGMHVSENAIHPWKLKGTPMLTRRRRRVAAPGLLVLGDAAGYVEPFTGEGMTWALASAQAAADLSVPMIHSNRHGRAQELADSWQHWHDTTLLRRQRTSRLARAVTHRPALAGAALALLGVPLWRTAIAGTITRRLSAPYPRPSHLAESSPFCGAAP